MSLSHCLTNLLPVTILASGGGGWTGLGRLPVTPRVGVAPLLPRQQPHTILFQENITILHQVPFQATILFEGRLSN